MNEVRICDKNELSSLLRGILSNTLRQIMSEVNAECGSLFLFDSNNKELVLHSFYNSINLALNDIKQRIGEGVCGKVVDMKKPVLVKNIDEDIRFKRNGFNHYHTKSFISIPLFNSQGLLGIINIADKASGEPFSENDLRLAVCILESICSIVESFNNYAVLKEKYVSVGKLAAGVVHEINNPLDGIIRYTNILLQQLDNNPIAREYLLEVKKGLNRIATITKSLLEFSRQTNIDASQIKKYVQIHELIDETLDFLSEKANGNIRLEKKYEPGLPRILDIGLSHMFINVIKNALDAMPDGGKLEITTDFKDSTVEIIFKDTGIGMSPDIIEHIFEPFFTTKSIDKGTGLGLAISDEIIRKYEGKIEVESSPGKGSTFRILIPKEYTEKNE